MGIFSGKSLSKRLGLILQLHKSIPLAYKLLTDRRVPLADKLWFIIPAVLYLAIPLDFDYIPLLGQLDDLTVLIFLFDRFLGRVPDDILRSHLKPVDR